MNFSLFATLASALVSAAVFTSCTSSPTPLASKPPVKALKVSEFSHGDGFLIKKFQFPADTYMPTMEDKTSYFYSPPTGRVKVFDTGMTYGQSAGIYVDKTRESPTGIYVKGLGNNYGKLKKDDIPAQIIR
jgi:hypothetical protein